MGRKENIKTGVSVIGSVKNYVDHRKFKKQIEGLYDAAQNIGREVSFSQASHVSLGERIRLFHNQFKSLYRYCKVNVKKLFLRSRIQHKEIVRLKQRVTELEATVRELKGRNNAKTRL